MTFMGRRQVSPLPHMFNYSLSFQSGISPVRCIPWARARLPGWPFGSKRQDCRLYSVGGIINGKAHKIDFVARLMPDLGITSALIAGSDSLGICVKGILERAEGNEHSEESIL